MTEFAPGPGMLAGPVGARLKQISPRDEVLALLLSSSSITRQVAKTLGGHTASVDYEMVQWDRVRATKIYHLIFLKA